MTQVQQSLQQVRGVEGLWVGAQEEVELTMREHGQLVAVESEGAFLWNAWFGKQEVSLLHRDVRSSR